MDFDRVTFGPGLMVGSLAALAAGIAIGVVANETGNPLAGTIVDVAAPLGQLWARALRMIVLPMVVAMLFVAVVRVGAGGTGRLGIGSAAVFLALLLAGAAFTLTLAPPVIELLPWDLTSVPLPSSPAPVEIPSAGAAEPSGGATEWIVNLVPTNPVRAAAEENLLQLIVFTVLFALAASRLEDALRDLLTRAFEAIAQATLVVVGWLLWLTPLGVFGLTVAFGRGVGLDLVGIVVAFVVILSALLVAFTGVLYVFAGVVGRYDLRDFAVAVWPAQLVALGTRSSLASLPALIEEARERLRMPDSIQGFVLPFAASTFKVNRTVSATFDLLFLSALFAIDLDVGDIVSFLLMVLATSITTIGVPGGSRSFRMLPVYVALGIPVEGYLMLQAADDVPDVFKTLANTTAYMTAAVMVDRLFPGAAPREPGTVSELERAE